jgi:hypothetical protein
MLSGLLGHPAVLGPLEGWNQAFSFLYARDASGKDIQHYTKSFLAGEKA